jgi:hypothetical protein
VVRFSHAAALLTLAFVVCPAFGLPKAGQVQPDRIPVGVVRVGAIVEASCMVFEPGKDPMIPFAVVAAPGFVTVRNTEAHHQQFGPGNDFICGTVEFSIDTSVAGDFAGDITVMLGNAAVKIPVSATVRPAKKGLTRLLVVETPFDRYSTDRGEMFKGWTDLVKDASLDVSYLLVTPGKPVLRDLDLSKFDCILLAESGLISAQTADFKRVRAFAEAGGRVLVAANAFFMGTVDRANAILDGYGIKVINEEARHGTDDVTLEKGNFDPSLVKAGLKTARFFRASPVRVTDDRLGQVLVTAAGVGTPGEGFVASAKAGKGEVIALGESLWWSWIAADQARGTDNALLFRRLLEPAKEK